VAIPATSAALTLTLALAIVACGKSEQQKAQEEAARDLGAQTADIAADTRLLGDAQAAVNEVVRNAPDCEAAKASMEAANQKLAEADRQVRTSTGRVTLDAMRKQLKQVSELCP
jgi:DNA repair exonuclease SbcCD ATPase subunit